MPLSPGATVRTCQRGYVLLEVAVGGAMVAVVVFGLLGSLAEGRTRNVIGGRDVIASQLALDKIEMQRARGFGNTGTGCTAGVETIQNQGIYKRDCVAASCPAKIMFGVTVNCERVTVTVEYTTSLGVRDVVVVTEVYQ